MYLQLDTRFNPFTYDEMVKPLVYYKQAYDEAEAAYSDLATQTEAWKDIANREKSPEAFEMYQRYSGDLSRAVDDFSQGMTAKNRRALLGLKRRYAQDIAPIARASEAMNAANELRAKASPDAIFEVGEYNSLDQFLHGKTANNKFQSRDALIKQTATMTEAAMAEAMRDPEFQKVMGDQYWEIKQHTGGSYKDLIEAIKLGMMDNPLAQNRFSQIRQEMLKKAGIERYDAAGQQAISGAVDLGLYAGLDKPVIQFQANVDHVTPVQAHQMAIQNAQLALAREELQFKKNRAATADKAATAAAEAQKEANEAYVANNVIYESNNGSWDVPGDMSASVPHGALVSYEDLPSHGQEVKKIVDKHLSGSDPRQYEFYIWRPSYNLNKTRVQIMRKQAYSKPGPANPASNIDISSYYLSEI